MIELAILFHPPKIVPAGEGEPVGVPFHPTEKLLAGAETEDGAVFYLFRVPPRSPGAPPHVHTKEDEWFYVVSGAVSVLNGEEVVSLGQGGFAAMTRDHLHAFWNEGKDEAVLLVGASRGGFEQFFDAVAKGVAENPDLTPPEAGAMIGKLAAERGITIRMDKVPDEARGLYGLE